MPNPSPDPMMLDSTGQAIVGALDDIKTAIENSGSGSGGAGKVYDETKKSEIFNDLTNNTATGYYSHAEGQSTTASGSASHAEGNGATASGYYSHAEGSYATAAGEGSHAEGYSSTGSSAKYAHAEGDQCSANGRASHAEGSMNTAGGYASHAGGQDCYVGGDYSFASGLSLSVNVPNSAAFGKYNLASSSSDTNPIIFAVGNGTRPVGSQPIRSNAFEAHQDGTCKAGGQQIIAIDPPTTDGTYTLQCTVSNGVATFSWV